MNCFLQFIFSYLKHVIHECWVYIVAHKQFLYLKGAENSYNLKQKTIFNKNYSKHVISDYSNTWRPCGEKII